MIALKDATFSYSGSERPALSRVNISFEAGEFALVCGSTGSGKSTLLRLLNGLAPHFTGGSFSGQLLMDGIGKTGSLPHDLAFDVGFVNQQPESSFVSDTVEEEIVYGMEQLGFTVETMAHSLERVAKLTGIYELLKSPLAWLSGGQQQRVAIAAALAAGQRILLLDEPTSALDPQAASEVIGLLERLSHEEGITVILVEHRIERVIEVVDSIVVVAQDGLVTKGGTEQFNSYHLVPPLIELATKLKWQPIPLSITEAKERWSLSNIEVPLANRKEIKKDEALVASNIKVSYSNKIAVDIERLSVSNGEVLGVIGPNGSGKSSLLWALQGSIHSSSGEVWTEYGDPRTMSVEERLCVVTLIPQRASDLLFLPSLGAELSESDNFLKAAEPVTSKIFEDLAGRIDPRIHPRDLSAGQQLALVVSLQLSKGAGIVLLDEPTRGLDYQAKKALARQLKKLAGQGKAVILASHDVEFVALVADRVVELESGKLVSDSATQDAIGNKSKHPTQIASIVDRAGVLTIDDLEFN